jgi:hypothetical protein
MRMRGHATVWGATAFVPTDVRAMNDAAAIRERILNHITAYHTALKDAGIDNFDLYNEPFHERDLLINKLIDDADDLAAHAAEVATWFNQAKEADPNAKLFINDYNMLNFWQENDSDIVEYKALVDAIRDAGGQIDGIGLQAHMDRFITKEQITRRLDILGAPMAPTANFPSGLPGLRIEITELDINTQQWTTATPAQQAEVTANVLEAAFEHPSVDGVTIWVMNDSGHWRDNAIMFDDSSGSWEVKPSGQAWIDRVTDTWWTDVSGSTNTSGQFTGTAFHGKHRVTVSYNQKTVQVERDFDDATEAVEIVVDTSTPDLTSPFLSNLSVRAPLNGGQNLSLGFVIDGSAETIVARVVGPGLAAFGVPGTMPDPRFDIRKSGSLVTSNDNWRSGLVANAATNVGAFSIPTDSADAAIVTTLSGGNTVEIVGDQGGVMLAEVYDASVSATGSRLTNVSALNFSGTGTNVLTAGFFVNGTGTARLLIRGVGTELSGFGVAGVMSDPAITVYRIVNGQPSVVATNDNWDASLMDTMASLGAFALDSGSTSAALVVEVPAPGGYTVEVAGVGGGTGVALVEVYEIR